MRDYYAEKRTRLVPDGTAARKEQAVYTIFITEDAGYLQAEITNLGADAVAFRIGRAALRALVALEGEIVRDI